MRNWFHSCTKRKNIYLIIRRGACKDGIHAQGCCAGGLGDLADYLKKKHMKATADFRYAESQLGRQSSKELTIHSLRNNIK